MSKKNNIPTWDDTEEILPTWDDTEEIFEPSQLEAGLRGTGQGVTLGYLDEMIAAGKAIPEDIMGAFSSDTSGVQPLRDEQGRITNLDDFPKGNYEKYRDEQRAQDLVAKEAHPLTYGLSEVAGGILPGALTGGGTATANLGKTALKEGFQQSMKKAVPQAAKLGAGYGAVSGAGYSEEDNLAGLTKDTLIGAGTGAVLGAAVPVALAGAKQGIIDPLSSTVKKGVNMSKSIPIVGDFVESFQMGAKGTGVLGKKAYEDIIDKSKKIVTNKLTPFLVTENQKNSKAIGKVIKRISNLDNKKDVSKQLSSIEKQIDNLIDTGKVPTEEGKKVLQELTGSISNFKKNIVNVSPTKTTDTGVQSALKSLEKQKNKITKTGEEVGSSFNFTEPKVDLDSGIVTMFETRTGKVLSAPIKTGEFTPIKVKNTSQYQDLTVDQLKGLKDSAFELMQKAKKGDLGAAKRPVGKLYGTAKDTIQDMAEDSSLGGALVQANKGFSTIKGIDELLPTSLLKGDKNSVNKVAQFLRKADSEGISGDDLRDRLTDLHKELKSYNPNFAEKFKQEADEIAKRYLLARLSKQSFGLNLGTGKALSVMAGGTLGSTARVMTTPVRSVVNSLSKMPKNQVQNMANKYSASSNKGVRFYGDQLSKIVTQEGQAKDQAIWALSQNPAFRELIKREIPNFGQGVERTLETGELQDGDMGELGPTQISPEFANGGVVEASLQENINDVEKAIDGVNQQQSSGDSTPVYHLDDLLGKINKLRISEEDKDELESEAANMEGYSDGVRLKELLRKLSVLR